MDAATVEVEIGLGPDGMLSISPSSFQAPSAKHSDSEVGRDPAQATYFHIGDCIVRLCMSSRKFVVYGATVSIEAAPCSSPNLGHCLYGLQEHSVISPNAISTTAYPHCPALI